MTALSPTLVQADPVLLERAVSNLLENAVKYSPPGAPIEVSVRGGEVVVQDHGPGIAEEDLPRVFDRFYRAAAARSKPGAGLGLAIVREAAEAHGGTATAETNVGRRALPSDAPHYLRCSGGTRDELALELVQVCRPRGQHAAAELDCDERFLLQPEPGSRQQPAVAAQAVAGCEHRVLGLAVQIAMERSLSQRQVRQIGHDDVDRPGDRLEQVALPDANAGGKAEAGRVPAGEGHRLLAVVRRPDDYVLGAARAIAIAIAPEPVPTSATTAGSAAAVRKRALDEREARRPRHHHRAGPRQQLQPREF